MSNQDGRKPFESFLDELEKGFDNITNGAFQLFKEVIFGQCVLCDEKIDLDDPNNWKQVRGFVGGPKKDSMRLREDTGFSAHDECVRRLNDGQAVDQPDITEEDSDERQYVSDDELPDDLRSV